MKMRMAVVVLVAACVLCVALGSTAFAQEFSADMVSTSKTGTFKGTMYVGKDKTRMESADNITITRMDKKVVWILMPKEKMYMEQPFDPKASVPASGKVEKEVERVLVGKEKVSGQLADKYQVTYMNNGEKETMYQWLAPGLQIPVKLAAADNSWAMEYKNIKKGAPADSLFEVPADYQKFSMKMPSMKGMLKGMAGQ